MAKKFDSVLSALEAVHGNTEKTNQILAAQIKLDKDQEDRARKDKIATDQKDKAKPMANIAKGLGITGTASKTGNSLLDFAKLTAGLAGIELLMRNIEAIKDAIRVFGDGLQDVVQTMTSLGVIKTAANTNRFTGNRGSGVDPETGETGRQKRARLKKEAAARARAMAASNTFENVKAQAAAAAAEQKRIKAKQAKLNADIQKTTGGLTLDDIVYDEKSKQYRNKQYGGYVKKDIVKQLKLLDLETNKPKISKSTPRPVAIDPDIGDPRNAPGAKGRSGFQKPPINPLGSGANPKNWLNAMGENYNFRAGGGILSKGKTVFTGTAKTALQMAEPLALGYSAYTGYKDKEYKKTGMSGLKRVGAGIAEDTMAVFDLPAMFSNLSNMAVNRIFGTEFRTDFKTNVAESIKEGIIESHKMEQKSWNLLRKNLTGGNTDVIDNDMNSAIVKLQKQFTKSYDKSMLDGSISSEEHVALRMLVTQMEMAISQMTASQAQNVINTVNNTTLPPSYQLQIETADLD